MYERNILSMFKLITFILVFVKCYCIKIEDGIYLNAAVTGSLTNAIKKCENGECIIINAVNNGVYIDSSSETSKGEFKKLIKCKQEVGCISEIATEFTYYLDESSKDKDSGKYSRLIKCVENDEKYNVISSRTEDDGSTNGEIVNNSDIKCSIYKNTISETEITINYYLSDYEGQTDALISCNKEVCILEDKNIVGYFKNTSGNAIVCEGGDCNLLSKSEVKTCSATGDFTVKADGKAYLCINNNDNEAIEISDSNVGNYIISPDKGSIFNVENSQYVVVFINGYSAQLNIKYNGRYVYVDNINKNKIFERGKCPKKLDQSIDKERMKEIYNCIEGVCLINENYEE